MDSNPTTSLDGLDSVLNTLYSPGLNRYMMESYGLSNEEIDAQFAHLLTQADSAPYQSTRSRAPTAPFSPLRVPESRFGQQYYVPMSNEPHTNQHHQQPSTSSQHVDNVPVLHIPEDRNEAQSGNQSDDEEYNNFLRSITNPSDVTVVEKEKTKKVDPPYYYPKRKTPTEDEEYNRPVTKNEHQELLNDLKENPVPGVPTDTDLLLLEPPMTTRSAARRSSDIISPTPSMSPGKTSDVYHSNQQYHANTAAYPSGSAAFHNGYPSYPSTSQPPMHSKLDATQAHSRTSRTHLRGPQEASAGVHTVGEAFKKPLPVVKTRGKGGKTLLTRKDEPQPASGKNIQYAQAGVNSPNPPSSTAQEASLEKEIRKRFDNVAVKFKQFCENKEFPEDQKEFVVQMMNKAINRADDKEGVILSEFIMRVVALVTGQMDALKVEPFVKEARKVDLSFASVVFGVLIHDGSPLVLNLMPHLFGKTKLIKAMQKEYITTAAGKQRDELTETFQAAMRFSDHPYRFPRPNYGSSAARKLCLTGKEGLLNPQIFEFMTEEVISNPEKIIMETPSSTTPRSSLGTDSEAKPVVASNTQKAVTAVPDRLMDTSQLLHDGNSNDSFNSTHHILNTGHIAEGGPDTPGSVLDFNAIFSGVPTPPSAFPNEMQVGGLVQFSGDQMYSQNFIQPPMSIPRPARRVPLLSSPLPLTTSPMKSAGSPFTVAVNSPLCNSVRSPGRARYEFRSTTARGEPHTE